MITYRTHSKLILALMIAAVLLIFSCSTRYHAYWSTYDDLKKQGYKCKPFKGKKLIKSWGK